jgi:DNA-binding NarL/FixJ family response regulator
VGFFKPDELRILELLAAGYLAKDIAAQLGVSEEHVREIEKIIEDTVHDYRG